MNVAYKLAVTYLSFFAFHICTFCSLLNTLCHCYNDWPWWDQAAQNSKSLNFGKPPPVSQIQLCLKKEKRCLIQKPDFPLLFLVCFGGLSGGHGAESSLEAQVTFIVNIGVTKWSAQGQT